jgi:hypothetical protein
VDYVVDGLDLYQFADHWLGYDEDTNIVVDDIVNWFDFNKFAENWLKTDVKYYVE